MTKGRTVITYGTFDLFHVGHLRLLKRCRELCGDGGKLIVAVSTDEFNEAEKHKKSVVRDVDRMEIVAGCRYVDEVIPESSWGQKSSDVITHGVDVFVMGDDWKGKFDYLSTVCRVVYLPRTPGVSTTELKRRLES